MNPNFDDPNNHVPEVTPGDDWGDGEAVTGDEGIAPVALPPKRAAAKKAALPKKPAFQDPKNHVPKVMPEDDWGDADDGPTILPRKRQADEKPAGFHAPESDDDKGIEIGVRVIEKQEVNESKAVVQRLEVQEHIPKLLAPEGTPPPKVVPKQVIEKSPNSEQPASEWPVRSAESETWGTAKKVPIRWMVISMALLALFVLAGVLILPKMGWKNEKSVRLTYSNLEVFDIAPQEVEQDELSLGEGIEEKAKKLVETYATAKNPDDVLALVRDRERVEPTLRARWKAMDVPPGWTVPDNSEWSIRKAGKRDFGYLAGMLPDITSFRFYIVQKGGVALLDWEASTGYSETPFADLTKRNGAGGVTRCVISPGDLYTYSMPEADYQCFRLGAPDGEAAVWGYVKRGSPLLEELTALFVQGAIPREIFSEYPITLRLAPGPAESLPNQWMIEEMLHLDWISP